MRPYARRLERDGIRCSPRVKLEIWLRHRGKCDKARHSASSAADASDYRCCEDQEPRILRPIEANTTFPWLSCPTPDTCKMATHTSKQWHSPIPSTVSHRLFRLTSVRTGSMPSLPEFKIEGALARGIILETIKTAEDSGAVVLRLFEALGGRGSGHLIM